MAYCGPRGIPLSTFLSWPPDDQQAALAWQQEEALRCPNCGTAEWEWDTEPDPEPYRAETKLCPGCHAKGMEQKNQQDRVDKTPGLYVRLIPTGKVVNDAGPDR